MREIPDAHREWNPDEGDKLVGRIMAFGLDEETGKRAFNIQPKDSNELIRVWRWKKGLSEEWDELDLEDVECVRIKYLGKQEAMKGKYEEEGPPHPKYEIDVLEC